MRKLPEEVRRLHRRLWYVRHYIPRVRSEPADDPAEIERRIAAMRLLKERGMMLRRGEDGP
jgi:hypothetical protein